MPCQCVSLSFIRCAIHLKVRANIYSSSDRGEGANHTIVDVLDLSHKVLPHLDSPKETLHAAIDELEEAIIGRTRSAVLASRQACLDAHESHALTATSPLLTRRQMYLNYES